LLFFSLVSFLPSSFFLACVFFASVFLPSAGAFDADGAGCAFGFLGRAGATGSSDSVVAGATWAAAKDDSTVTETCLNAVAVQGF